jgi:hypothetical protein
VATWVNTTEQAAELRRQAEGMALRRADPPPADPESTLPAWVVKALHDLRAHLLDLELQNAALLQAQVKQD